MPAYVITELTTHDLEEIEKYRKLVPETVKSFNGKFIVRGGHTTTLEGDWKPERIVVIEFPTVSRAQEWWNSEAYSKARVIRQEAADAKMIIVEGVQ